MTAFPSMSLLLLLVLCPCAFAAVDNSTNITEVECQGNQTQFRAQTELSFVGSNDLLGSMERTVLANAFVGMYNKITTDLCDSFFRRLERLDFVSMTNQLNETVTHLDTDLLGMLDDQAPSMITSNRPTESAPPQGLPRPRPGLFGRRQFVRSLQGSDLHTVNASSENAGVSVAFNVTGTCRNCMTAGSDSFELYDDALRLRVRFRYLQGQPQQPTPVTHQKRVRQVQFPPLPPIPARDLEEEQAEEEFPGLGPPGDGSPVFQRPWNTADCTCAAGLAPEKPAAPPIVELIAFINDRLPVLQNQQGHPFRDMILANIVQLDDNVMGENQEGTDGALAVEKGGGK
jgi:hypothetical protein